MVFRERVAYRARERPEETRCPRTNESGSWGVASGRKKATSATAQTSLAEPVPVPPDDNLCKLASNKIRGQPSTDVIRGRSKPIPQTPTLFPQKLSCRDLSCLLLDLPSGQADCFISILKAEWLFLKATLPTVACCQWKK